MPDGNLYTWIDNSLSSSLAQAPVATLPTYYYQNPVLLISPTPPPPTGVNAFVNGDTLTVNDPNGYLGTALVNVVASNGSLSTTQAYQVTFTDNSPPALSITPTSITTSSTAVTATLSPSSGTSYTGIQIGGSNALFLLEQQYDLRETPGVTNYFVNARGVRRNTCSAATATIRAAAATTFSSPTAICSPTCPTPPTTWPAPRPAPPSPWAPSPTATRLCSPMRARPMCRLPIMQNTIWTCEPTFTYYFNAHGAQEKYLASVNNSNPAGGNFYVLLPNGNLYAWTGNSLNTSLANPPVASLPTFYYDNPGFLLNATPPGGFQVTAESATSVQTTYVSASISGTTLTVSDTSGFKGTVIVYVTVSDGALTTTQTLQVTFT